MSKARLSKKRVVLRRAGKRRTRYDGAEAGGLASEPLASLRWRSGAEPGRPPWLTLDLASPDGDLVEA